VKWRRPIAIWIPTAVLATALCGLIYVAVQQDLRSGANDPQEQLARDAVASLEAGAAPAAVVGTTIVDLSYSLAAFVIVNDQSGAVLASSGRLDGLPPVVPAGVLATARAATRDAVTWQPRTGLRFATVTLVWHGGSVTAGRSLELVEQRENNLVLEVAAAWTVTIVALVFASIGAAWIWRRD
jgi:hypothetical protein